MGMNDKPLEPSKEMSTFFYENKLYEFSQKELSDHDRSQMKLMSETVPEAKYSIGGVLMSLEYLSQLSSVVLEVKDMDYEALGKKTKLQYFLNGLFFLLLTIIFSLSGYFLIMRFILEPSN